MVSVGVTGLIPGLSPFSFESTLFRLSVPTEASLAADTGSAEIYSSGEGRLKFKRVLALDVVWTLVEDTDAAKPKSLEVAGTDASSETEVVRSLEACAAMLATRG
ncbi:hypothetical protein AGMMS50296_3950 [Alphaproteobacteria bacterium]|nr:hypothetical protein AGMMS50296_3950 [Alphaproteobacteria bacterium]